MFNRVSRLGHATLEWLANLGTSARFLGLAMSAILHPHFSWRDLRYQIFSLGVLSLLLIAVAALFTGMVLAFQGYKSLSRFGATGSLGPLITLSLVRELGLE